MKIGGLQKTTLIDFPGRIACTVFLSGCGFRCPWCYSPELVLPEEIAGHPEIKEDYFFDFLKKRKGDLDGVVICGGEPTINNELPKFLQKIRDLGFAIKLDTNGSNPEMLEKLLGDYLLDYIAMDVKAPLTSEKYEKATGMKIDVEKIRKSVNLIKNSGVDYEFRSTIVPGVHTKEDIIQMAKDISPACLAEAPLEQRLAKKYYLQNFRPGKNINPEFEKIKPYSDEFFQEVLKEISSLFEICKFRG